MRRKVILTRELPLDKGLEYKLKQAGFDVFHIPLIECRPNAVPNSVAAAIPKADWIFFTSAAAVDCFKDYLNKGEMQVATVGPQTSLAVKQKGYKVHFEAKGRCAADLTKEWLALGLVYQTILLPQSSLSNSDMVQTLRQKGHRVFDWAVYDTVPNFEGQRLIKACLTQESVIWTFASSSAWHSFASQGYKLPQNHRIAAIGNSTAQAVEADGCTVNIVAKTPSIAQMIFDIILNEKQH